MRKYSNAYIFHGAGGFPEEGWFPWLKAELEKRQISTTVPQFPTDETESLATWLQTINNQEAEIGPETLIVGHSRGGMFLLKFLEQLDRAIDTAVFVAAPIGEQPILFYDQDKAFSGFEFDWLNIFTKAKNNIVIHSDNDPYVSLANGEKLAKQLRVDLNFVPGSGHFNKDAGYTQFPLLLEFLESIDS